MISNSSQAGSSGEAKAGGATKFCGNALRLGGDDRNYLRGCLIRPLEDETAIRAAQAVDGDLISSAIGAIELHHARVIAAAVLITSHGGEIGYIDACVNGKQSIKTAAARLKSNNAVLRAMPRVPDRFAARLAGVERFARLKGGSGV